VTRNGTPPAVTETGGGLVSQYQFNMKCGEKYSVPDALHAHENRDQGYQQADSGKQRDRDKRIR
jgi:hypothetical protein